MTDLPLEKLFSQHSFPVKVQGLTCVHEARSLLSESVAAFFNERTEGTRQIGQAWAIGGEISPHVLLSRAGSLRWFLEQIPRMSLDQCQDLLLAVHHYRQSQDALINSLRRQSWELGGNLEQIGILPNSDPLEIDDSSNEWG